MGYIYLTPEMDSERFQNEAIIQIEQNFRGASVYVRETVTLRPTRATETRLNGAQMRQRLTTPPDGFTFELEVIDVYVNGNFEATLRNMTDVTHLRRLLQEERFTMYTRDAEFVEDWELRSRLVDPSYDSFVTPTEGMWRLQRTVEGLVPYVVQDGDNLDRIAIRHGLSLNTLLLHNPDFSIYSLIFPGQILQIRADRPLLSVRTFDYMTDIITVEMPIEIRHNPALAPGATEIFQQGRNGQALATMRITRVDGVEESVEILEDEIIDPPTPHIVYMATLPPASDE